MATQAQPPQAPAAPLTPRSRSNFFWIALLILVLILVVGGLGVLMGVRVLSNALHVDIDHSDSGKKEVSIKTPFGGLEVRQGVNAAGLGVPIYPGAAAMGKDDSATVNLDIANENKLRVLAGKFETDDSIENVLDFYASHLGSDATKTVNSYGKTVFQIKHGNETRVVAIQSIDRKTVIEIAYISEGPGEAN